MNNFTSFVRRCVDDYGMISDDDAVAVGLSGGKDSLALLCALDHLRGYYPKKFRLEAVTIDLGFEGMDFSEVSELCRRLRVPYTIVKTDIREIIFDLRDESNPCSLCSKMRRGALNDAIRARGINKLALGHHFDDAIETFFMSLLYEGHISSFKPVTWMSRAEVWQIRPLLYVGEERISSLVAKYKLPVVESLCPLDKTSKRQEIKALVKSLSADYPDLKSKVFGAMQRLPLDGWEKDR